METRDARPEPKKYARAAKERKDRKESGLFCVPCVLLRRKQYAPAEAHGRDPSSSAILRVFLQRYAMAAKERKDRKESGLFVFLAFFCG
jgi:hypothetical protein